MASLLMDFFKSQCDPINAFVDNQNQQPDGGFISLRGHVVRIPRKTCLDPFAEKLNVADHLFARNI